jgi:hypothetical protein
LVTVTVIPAVLPGKSGDVGAADAFSAVTDAALTDPEPEPVTVQAANATLATLATTTPISVMTAAR